MSDPYAGVFVGVSDPSTHARAVAPSDSADLADVPKGIYVGTGGDITMIGAGAPAGAAGHVWKNVSAGSLIPFRPRRILATGTNATDILALY